MNVVIIHSQRDHEFVEQLTERLRDAGVRVWLDNEETRTNDNVIDRMTHESEDVEYMATIISQSFAGSHWIAHELST